ncbi:MAG: UDP-glucose 4-epimerase GalE [Actinomycetota bacterium]|nr:UDP-glucose 4-epimerase GalE [Actinomycetota bacterium]
MRYLVSGGAGYIGSVVAGELVGAGHDVVVLDDLSTGHADGVPAGVELVARSIVEAASVLSGGGFDGVLHFAAKSLVGESVEHPDRYWHNNVTGSVALLDAVRAAGVPRFVFSSSAATYGEPDEVPITEDAPARPTNPYGATKLSVDMAITSYCTAYRIGAVSLRYFNVAGAAGPLGERHATETHLIPIALQVASGRRPSLQIFGDDYPTEDGTCVRDYIHVLDLADAHLRALDACAPGRHLIVNLGSGRGYSVAEVAQAVRRVTDRPVPAEVQARRAGDPAVLVASVARAAAELGWTPSRDIDQMVGDAWTFAQRREELAAGGAA